MESSNKVVWANSNFPVHPFFDPRSPHNSHWSRLFEYPWAALNGDFQKGHKVLDAGGGATPFQDYLVSVGCDTTNIDLTVQPPHAGVTFVQGDLRATPFAPTTFDRVACLSVLEHITQPIGIVRELLRVLKPKGKLIMTFDVASYRRHNHTIDEMQAEDIVSFLSMKLPECDISVLRQEFPELSPKFYEPRAVNLRVLCLTFDKV